MPVSSVHQALRDATARLHEAIEHEADVEARLRDHDERPGMVARLHALHDAVDHALAPWREAVAAAGYDLEGRSGLLRRNLEGLAQAPCPAPPRRALTSLGEALGWLYVAEGSMLGGRAMRRAMAADGVSLTGLDFLDPHGEETGTRWRAFLHAMDRACASGRAAQADVVRGGRDAFDLAFSLLVSPRPSES